jgi:hypothetical protein
MRAGHIAFLTAHQNGAYARRYAQLAGRARAAELSGRTQFSQAIARSLFR